MTPSHDRSWIQTEFDWIHGSVHSIGVRCKWLDVDPKHFADFEQSVLAAVRLLRFELDIPYSTYEQWREDQIKSMKADLARLAYHRRVLNFEKVWNV